jgi:D-alanyl-D-alanine endopeptidase (penicillin-binding protein 7)
MNLQRRRRASALSLIKAVAAVLVVGSWGWMAPAQAGRVEAATSSKAAAANPSRAATPPRLASSVALVVDPRTNQVLFSKNADAVLPIASITKLMTAIVILESGLSMDDRLRVGQDDVDTEKGSTSRLQVGSSLTRGQMLHLALMSSENRAAHALGRHHPGGLNAFVQAMNRKARALGMSSTSFVEPTGLSSDNRSSASDLTLLVREASRFTLIRELSTARDALVPVGRRRLEFRNTNSLIRDPDWDIGLQKTGYIAEAGRCVVMQAEMAGRQLILVLLDATGRQARKVDAERLRRWLGRTLPSAGRSG